MDLSCGHRFPYFFINLYTSLTVVESLMMAIAAIVPHYLMGIAGVLRRRGCKGPSKDSWLVIG